VEVEVRRDDDPDVRDEATGALPLEGVRVLLVDDEEDVTSVYREALARVGAHVEATFDGEAGLSVLREKPFDVVVSDLDMPRLDGLEMVRALRSGQGGALPALAISGSAQPDVRVAALRAGFDAFAPKPIGPRALVHTIVRLLERRAARGRDEPG